MLAIYKITAQIVKKGIYYICTPINTCILTAHNIIRIRVTGQNIKKIYIIYKTLLGLNQTLVSLFLQYNCPYDLEKYILYTNTYSF